MSFIRDNKSRLKYRHIWNGASAAWNPDLESGGRILHDQIGNVDLTLKSDTAAAEFVKNPLTPADGKPRYDIKGVRGNLSDYGAIGDQIPNSPFLTDTAGTFGLWLYLKSWTTSNNSFDTPFNVGRTSGAIGYGVMMLRRDQSGNHGFAWYTHDGSNGREQWARIPNDHPGSVSDYLNKWIYVAYISYRTAPNNLMCYVNRGDYSNSVLMVNRLSSGKIWFGDIAFPSPHINLGLNNAGGTYNSTIDGYIGPCTIWSRPLGIASLNFISQRPGIEYDLVSLRYFPVAVPTAVVPSNEASIDQSLPLVTQRAEGRVKNRAVIDQLLPLVTQEATGIVINTCGIDQTLPLVTQEATASALILAGASNTLPLVTQESTASNLGFEDLARAYITQTLPSVTQFAEGGVLVLADASQILPLVTQYATVDFTDVDSGISQTLPKTTQFAEAITSNVAGIDQTLPLVTQSAIGANLGLPPRSAHGDQTLPLVTQEATASALLLADASSTLPLVTQYATGLFVAEADASNTLPLVTQYGLVGVPLEGEASQTLPLVTQYATGWFILEGEASQTLPLVKQSADAIQVQPREGDITQTLPLVEQSAFVRKDIVANASQTLPLVQQEGYVGFALRAEITQTLPRLTQEATGQLIYSWNGGDILRMRGVIQRNPCNHVQIKLLQESIVER